MRKLTTFLLIMGLSLHASDRCFMPSPRNIVKTSAASDCGQNITVIRDQYNPTELYTIPVVVHVIYGDNNEGRVSEADIHDMLRILNEDFRAKTNTAGGNGIDSGIAFELANADPNGNATTGITYTHNPTWFSGNFHNMRLEHVPVIGWDYTRYMNIFITGHDGPLGFGLQMPWYEDFNPALEGVGIHYTGVGNLNGLNGRVITHEVGHYFGLWHTFGIFPSEDCLESDCYSEGDMVCDTPAQIDYNPDGCTSSDACAAADPVENYMNYSPLLCQSTFTAEQINRMRCTLLSWRPALVKQDTPVRWLPHVARIGGDFNTRLFARNTSSEEATITLIGYDSSGNQLDGAIRDRTVPGNGFLTEPLDNLFGNLTTLSHLGITGSASVKVSMGYRVANGIGATAHLNEQRWGSTKWYFYPGERDLVFDGIAALNVGSAATDITVRVREKNGTVRESKTLASHVMPLQKVMGILSVLFENSDEAVIEVEASQPLLIIALRGSQGGDAAYLYESIPTSND